MSKCPVCNNDKGSADVCPFCNWKTFPAFANKETESLYMAALLKAQQKWVDKKESINELDQKPLDNLLHGEKGFIVPANSYKLSWGTKHPGHLVYLLDLSQSMRENGKIDYVIDTIGQVSEYLIGMCEEEDDEENIVIKARFSITILGYNSDVFELFKGTVVDLDQKLEGLKGKPLFDKTNEAKPQWQTYTAKAFKAVAKDINEWIMNQQDNGIDTPAPVVIHVTDGYPYEEENKDHLEIARRNALAEANNIKNIHVPDGDTLLFNIHIDNTGENTLSFPVDRPMDVERQFLYDASSIMTDKFVTRARDGFKLPAKSGSRFMISNESDKITLAKLIAFGSSVTCNGNSKKETPKFIPR